MYEVIQRPSGEERIYDRGGRDIVCFLLVVANGERAQQHYHPIIRPIYEIFKFMDLNLNT